MRASLNNWRGSPRKFNEYLRAVRGMNALKAASRLKFMTSPYAQALRKLINSAVANATQNSDVRPTNLILDQASVGRAVFYKRVRFQGRGRMGRVTRFGSNVDVRLKNSDSVEKQEEKRTKATVTAKTEKKISLKTEKKVAVKKTVKKKDGGKNNGQ